MRTATGAIRSANSAPVDHAYQRGGARARLTYSVFMNGLKKAAITVDRKVLADIAVLDKPAFGKFVEKAKASLGV